MYPLQEPLLNDHLTLWTLISHLRTRIRYKKQHFFSSTSKPLKSAPVVHKWVMCLWISGNQARNSTDSSYFVESCDLHVLAIKCTIRGVEFRGCNGSELTLQDHKKCGHNSLVAIYCRGLTIFCCLLCLSSKNSL